MRRRLTILYTAVSAVEVAYLLRANLPKLLPPPPCDRMELRSLVPCVLIRPGVPWFWFLLSAVLMFSAIAVLLRKRAGIPIAAIAQVVLVPGVMQAVVYDAGSFFFTGSGYSGVNPSYRDLAFNVLVLAIVIGPALAALLLMTSRETVSNRGAARAAAIVLAVQLVAMAAAAIVVFQLTYQDCLHNGPGTPVIDGVPGCPDYADLDTGSLLATIAPSAAVMLLVAAGVWRGRGWAVASGLVWQLLLAVQLLAVGVELWSDPNQNAWYDRFPLWSSPRWVAYALLILAVVPALAALLAARSPGRLTTPSTATV